MATGLNRNKEVDYETCTYSNGPATLDGSPLVVIRRVIVEDYVFVHSEADAARLIVQFKKMDKEHSDV